MTTIVEEEPYAAVVSDRYLESTCSKCFAWNLVKTEDPRFKDHPDRSRVNLFRCAGCRLLHYCSKECQSADWEDHKFECKGLRTIEDVPSHEVRIVARILNKDRAYPDFKAFNGKTYASLSETYEEGMRSKVSNDFIRALYEDIVLFMGKRAPDLDTVGRAYFKLAKNSFSIYDGTYCCTSRGLGLYIGLSGHPHSCRADCFVISNGAKKVLRSRDPSGFCLYSPNLSLSFKPGQLLRVSEKRTFTKCPCEDCHDKEKAKRDSSGRSDCCQNGWFAVDDPKCSECGKEVSKERQELVEEGNINMGAFLDYCDNIPNFATVDFDYLSDKMAAVFKKYKDVMPDFNLNFVGNCEAIFQQMFTSGHGDITVECMERCMPIMRTMSPSVGLAAFYCQRTVLYYMIDNVPAKKRSEAIREATQMVHIVFGENHEIAQTFKKTLADHKRVSRRRR